MKNVVLKGIFLSTALVILIFTIEVLLHLSKLSYLYLTPSFESHDRLVYKIKPYDAGHDAWGFRNASIPEQADIVTIGDSFTYGVSNAANVTWPSVLGSLSGQRVYNLSIGGYGVAQYEYLLKEYANALKPNMIIVGLYLGDDLAFPNKQLIKTPPISTNHHDFNLRHWLAKNSILYNATVFSKVGDKIRYLESWLFSDQVTTPNNIYYAHNGIRTIFTPKTRFNKLNLKKPNVVEGYQRITERLLAMKRFCDKRDINFAIVIFPTKEMVFKKQLNQYMLSSMPASMIDLFEAEEGVNTQLKHYFQEKNIAYVDLLPSLSNASDKTKLFFQDANGHMAEKGHKIAAENIYRAFLLNAE